MWEGPFRRVPRLWDLLKALSLVEGLPCPDLFTFGQLLSPDMPRPTSSSGSRL